MFYALGKSSLQDFIQLQQDLDQLTKTRVLFHYHKRCRVPRQYKQGAHPHIYYLEIVLVAAPST